MRIVHSYIFLRFSDRRVCVAVGTEIWAGVVPAEIAALDTKTSALVSVVAHASEGAMIGLSDGVQRVAPGADNPEFCICIQASARLQREIVMPCRLCDRSGESDLLLIG